MHSDYAGFGNCPPGVDSFCVNVDLAIIRLGGTWPDQVSGTYGTYFGGMALGAYAEWIGDVTAVPEPATYAMWLAGLAVVAGIGRRRPAR